MADIFSGILLAAAFALIEGLIGGTRLVFSLPAYALLAAIAIFSLLSIRRDKAEANRVCLITSLAFFGYILIRAILSPVDYVARADIYSVLGCLVVYLFVACVLTEAKRRVWLIFLLLAIAVVHVGIGAIQFRDGNNFMLVPFLQRFDYGRRASGLYISPNHLAGFLEVIGVFGLSIGFWGRWPTWTKLLVLYITAICYVGVLLTASRGGYISSAVSLLVFFLFTLLVLRRAGKQLFTKFGGIAIFAAILIFITASFFTDKMLFLNDRARASIEEANDLRIDLWKAALQQWKLQPLTGTGSGTYLFYGRQFRSERTDRDPIEVHNDYLHLLAEYGLVGAAGFILFFGAHLHEGWKNFRRLGPKRVAVSTRLASNILALQIGGLSALAAYTVHSALDFNLHIPANALLLAFVFGIIANSGIQRENDTYSSAIPWRVILFLIGVVLAIQVWRLLPAEYFAERARVAIRDNQPTTSAAFAVRALNSEQNNPNIYYALGQAGVLEGNAAENPEQRAFFFQVAVVAFEKGWALAPRDEVFPLALASIYDGLHRFAEAEWMYSRCIPLDPNSVAIKEAYKAHLEKWHKSTTAPSEQVDLQSDSNPK
jgi:O-antigen ligase